MAYFQVGDLKVGLFAVLVAVLIVLVSVALGCTQVDQIKSPPLIVWVMRLGVPLLRTVKRRSACQPVRAFVRALVTIVHLARVGQTRPIFDRRLRACVSVPVTGVSPVAHSVPGRLHSSHSASAHAAAPTVCWHLDCVRVLARKTRPTTCRLDARVSDPIFLELQLNLVCVCV